MVRGWKSDAISELAVLMIDDDWGDELPGSEGLHVGIDCIKIGNFRGVQMVHKEKSESD